MSFIINPYRFAAGGATDPFFSNVVLLLHCDGTNGSTTFTDNSSSAKTVTANGNAQLSTASPKFGSAAVNFDGSGDYLSLSDSGDWHMTGDFTVELWIKPDTLGGVRTIIGQRLTSSQYAPWLINCNGATLNLLLSFDLSNWVAIPTIAGGSLSTGTWQHIAFVRSGNDFLLFLDGTQVGSTYTSSSAFTNSAQQLTIGGNSVGFYTDGEMDDIRITKGVARYTSNFTPPTAAFPDA